MRSMKSKDKNLIFRYNRGALIGEQRAANDITFDISSKKQNFDEIPTPNGQDKNLFFRVRKSLQPILKGRLINDLEPLSRVIGSLPITKKERQSERAVSSIEGILNALNKFMSTPLTDSAGNPVIDPDTNVPIFKRRISSDVLNVAHGAVKEVFKVNNITMTNTINNVLSSLNVDESVKIIENIQNNLFLEPNTGNIKKMMNREVIDVRLENIEDANPNIHEETITAISEEDEPNSWQESKLPDKWMRPSQWDALNTEAKGEFMKLLVRISTARGDLPLKGVGGTELNILTSPGRQFSGNIRAWLNMDTLEFKKISDVPLNERTLEGAVSKVPRIKVRRSVRRR